MKSPFPSPEVLPAGGGWVVLGFTVARLLVPTSPPRGEVGGLYLFSKKTTWMGSYTANRYDDIRYPISKKAIPKRVSLLK